jgi:hypothetical protein
MRRRVPKMVLALAPLLVLAACQDPDVGQPCTIQWNDEWEQSGSLPAPPRSTELWDAEQSGLGAGDYLETGTASGCDGLVCIVSPTRDPTYGSGAYDCPGCGYCSKPCVSNSDCFSDETGLVCRQMVLDAAFLEQLDPAAQERYLSGIRYSSYCAVPR